MKNHHTLRQLARRVLELSERATPGPWKIAGDKIVAIDDTGKMTEVATVSGGLGEKAEANAQLIALGRKLLPAFAGDVRELLPRTDPRERILDCSGNGEGGRATRAPTPLPDKLPPTAAIWFARAVADAIDDLVGVMGGHLRGLHMSDRNATPEDRLLSGGDDARNMRTQLLRALAWLVDPETDDAWVGEPTPVDFYDELRAIVRDAAADPPDDAAIELVEGGVTTILARMVVEHPEAFREALEVLDENLPTQGDTR